MSKIKKYVKAKFPKLVLLVHKVRLAFGSRGECLLYGIDKTQRGLEFGPSFNPIAPKKQGYQVEIVDVFSREDLIEHYKGHNVNLDAIEEVDYVGVGNYYDLIQKEAYYDYIIASHMIEHTTNMLKFLQDCSRMLKAGGCLNLAIPDKRYEFDLFRNVTDLSRVLDDYYNDAMTHSPGLVAEYLNNVVKRNGKISWVKNFLPWDRLRGVSFCHGKSAIDKKMEAVLNEGWHEDIHHYVFTPASFKLLIYDLRNMGLLDMEIIRMRGTKGNEFIVTLGKTQEKPEKNDRYRMRLLKKAGR